MSRTNHARRPKVRRGYLPAESEAAWEQKVGAKPHSAYDEAADRQALLNLLAGDGHALELLNSGWPDRPILPGLPGGEPYRRRALTLADEQAAQANTIARILTMTGDAWVEDKWAHRHGFPRDVHGRLEAAHAALRAGRARALGLITPNQGPTR